MQYRIPEPVVSSSQNGLKNILNWSLILFVARERDNSDGPVSVLNFFSQEVATFVLLIKREVPVRREGK